MPMKIFLERPDLKWIKSYFEFVREIEAAAEPLGWLKPKDQESLNDFINRLLEAETNPSPDKVNDSIYWCRLENEIVGRVSLRHFLNADLKEYGGHIGYEVRPSYRRRGIAKEMLRLILETPTARQIGKLLLTCSPKNVASIKAIVRNGGVFEKTAFVPKVNRETSYYWIDLYH